MRLSDLRDKQIRTLDGEALGRVHEVHCDGGRLIALMSGPGSFLERLTARKEGRRIPWACIVRIESKRIIVSPDPPQRIVSASRNRPGTRRANARRSKR
jgi:sporulation protein YlmC with PRC-barrel domain